MIQPMFAENRKRDERSQSELNEDVSREDIVAAFRSAMIGHFRSHIPGTNISEATLLASDYLNHFHELVMLLEAVSSEPEDFAEDLFAWKPLTYEEHFAESGFRDKNLAIVAYHRAPPRIRARFDDAVERLHSEATKLVGDIRATIYGKQPGVDVLCGQAVARLSTLIEEANAIANGEEIAGDADENANGEASGQAAIDALFDPDKGA
jgi:hypothetical protein